MASDRHPRIKMLTLQGEANKGLDIAQLGERPYKPKVIGSNPDLVNVPLFKPKFVVIIM